MEIECSRVLVTGGTRRLGQAISEGFAAAGAKVVATVRGGMPEIEAARKRVADGVLPISADVATDSAEGIIADAEAALDGPIDILVNCAAAFAYDDLASVDRDVLTNTLEVNVSAPILLTQALSRSKRASGAGLVLNMLDYKIINPFAGFLSYTTSKFALEGFTRVAARELAPNWRVCGIAPGYTLPGPEQPLEEFRANHDATPLHRGCFPADIVHAAVYLAQADAITGQTLFVDGGAHMMAQDHDFLFDANQGAT